MKQARNGRFAKQLITKRIKYAGRAGKVKRAQSNAV
jgi:hypothetical protein